MDDDGYPWQDDDDEPGLVAAVRRFAREKGLALGGLLTALVVVVLAGPAVAARIGDGLQPESTMTPMPSATASAGTQDAPDPLLAPTSTTPTTAPVPPATAAPVSTPAGLAEPAVTTIRTVPAVRDVILDIDGRQVATDAAGTVTVTADEADAIVTVIGTVAEPAVQTATFGMWADGSTEPERSLDTVAGPVAEIGLLVRSRVVVAAVDPRAAGTTATFDTPFGAVDLELGAPAWVPATVAVASADGLVATDLTYSLRGLSDGSASSAQTFRPTPEATWRIAA